MGPGRISDFLRGQPLISIGIPARIAALKFDRQTYSGG
jgi:hypothetical protein